MNSPPPLRSLAAAALCALPIALGPGPAGAATFEVSNTDDSGTGSLRQAILDLNNTGAPDSNTITFQGVGAGSTIRLQSPLDAISMPVTIDGKGLDLTVNRAGLAEIFSVRDGTTTVVDIDLGGAVNLAPGTGESAKLVFDESRVFPEFGILAGTVSGEGDVEKIGDFDAACGEQGNPLCYGVVALTGELEHTGGTMITEGVLFTVNPDTLLPAGGGQRDVGTGEKGALVVYLQAETNDREFGGTLSGNGMLAKGGDGELSLTGQDNRTGDTRQTLIDGGPLRANATSLQGNVVFGYSGPGLEFLQVVQHSDPTLIFEQSSDGTFEGDISEDPAAGKTGSVEKTGAGTLTLVGNNSYTGGTTVTAGALRGDSSSLQGTIVNNADLIFHQTSEGSFSGAISGSGDVEKTGAGTLTLSGANIYEGLTTITGGALRGDVAAFPGNVTFAPDPDPVKLIFHQETDDSYDDVISGTGEVEKTGVGTLAFSGIHTYTGLTTVSGGRLNINGEVAGDVQVDAGATPDSPVVLGGTGSIGGAVTVFGTVAPGDSIGMLTAGSVVFKSGSVLEVEVNPAGDPQGDVLTVDGEVVDGHEAVIESGARVEVLAEQGDYTEPVTVTILDLTGPNDPSRSGTFAEPEDLAFLAIILDHDSAAPNIELTVADSGATFEGFAETANQVAVARALDEVEAAPGSDLETVLRSRFKLTAGEVPAALDSVGGESLTQFATARQAVGARFNRALHTRIRGLAPGWLEFASSRRGEVLAAPERRWLVPGSGAAAAPAALRAANALGMAAAALGSGLEDPPSGFGGWLDGYGMLGKLEGDSGANDADYTIWGASLGVDRRLADRLILGIAGGYARTEVEFDWPEGSGDADVFQTALYGGYAVSRFLIGVSGRYAYSGMESERDIVFGEIVRQAEADFAGHEFGARVEAAVDAFDLGIFGFQPLVSFDYTHLSRESYTEEGADSLDLEVESEKIDSIVSGAGLRVHWTFDMEGGFRLVPEVWGLWLHEFGDRDRRIQARFTGATSGGSFLVRGVELARDSGVIGTRWTVLDAGGLELSADYQMLLNRNLREHSFGLQVRATW